MSEWSRYVVRIAETDVSNKIAAETDISQSTIYRWLHKGTAPEPPQAAKFALTYRRNVLEAFVAAGFLTQEEAALPTEPMPPDLSEVPGDVLSREIGRRLSESAAPTQQDHTLMADDDGTPIDVEAEAMGETP